MATAGSPGFGVGWNGVLEAAQLGAGWAFSRLFDVYGGPLAGYLRCQGVADYEGSVNEVFLRAFHGIGSFAGSEEQFRSWLFTVAHHLVVDERRRRCRRVVETELGDAVEGHGPVAPAAEAAALDRLGVERIEALLSELVPDQRDVLLLRIQADMTCAEVAASVGKSVGAVKQLQRRALESLRRKLASQAIPL